MTASIAAEMARIQAQGDRDARNEDRDYHRYELKFRLPISMIPELREVAAPYLKRDPHAVDRPGGIYTVRSIYFDTEDLMFYFDKLDSVRIRKKLRIRSYDRPEAGAPAFFEIKRKNGRRGYKERLCLPCHQVASALSGDDAILAERPFLERRVLQRFRYNIETKEMHPVVLISYEREPWIGQDDHGLRMTFDQNIRSLYQPRLDQLFCEEGLRQFEDKYFVLELKFNDRMPSWMAELMRDFDLKSHSYSKFTHGIDAWAPHPQ